MDGQRVEKKPGGGKGWKIAGAAAALLAAAYLGLCAWVGLNGKVMPNVSVAGVDVSGMTEQEAFDAVERVLTEYGDEATVTLSYKDWSGTMRAADFQRERFGGAAVFAGREHFLTQGFQYIRHLLGGSTELGLDFTIRVEQTALWDLLDEVEQHAGSTVRGMSYRVEGDRLVVTKGAPGVVFDSNWVLLAAADATEAALEQAIAQKGAVNAVVDLEQEEAASVTQPDEPDYNAVYAEIHSEAVEPVYDKATGTVSDHVVGVDFEVAELKAAYESAREGETFTLPLSLTQPRDTRESYESKLFADVLGQGTSTVSGTSNRKTNVKLAAEACDDVILLPGEVFSYNGSTGRRSAEKGYLPAGGYVGGRSEDVIGGGICQVSSTIYYAVLHTTLEIVERHDHSYAVSYLPEGMDATVYSTTLDFRFRNDTDYPIKVETESYDRGGKRKLTVKILGTNVDGRYAVPESTVYDVVEPTNQYVADKSVARGTTVEDAEQNPYRGRKARTYRCIYEADGTLAEKQDMGVSSYKMRPRILYYNPLDGDPASWANGVPPQPAPVEPEVTPPEQTQPDVPTPAQPEEPPAPVPEEIPGQNVAA